MIHIRDRRLLPLVVKGIKTTHRFPASYRDGVLTHPKIVPGTIHKIYVKAPFGSGGREDAEPLAEVRILAVEAEPLGDLTEDDARTEGFGSIEAYITWWDRINYKKAIRFAAHLHKPVWVVTFEFLRLLPAGEAMLEEAEQLRQLTRARNQHAQEEEA